MQNQFVTSPIDYDFTGAWGLANQQYEYFSNPENGYINGSVINIAPGSQKDISDAIKDGVQAGDVLYWSWKGDGFINHSTMITEIRKDMILYGGHSHAQQYADLYDMLSTYPNAKAYIVKICDNAE